MAFEQLLKALDSLFDSYDGLKLSLASLSEKVFNIRKDARSQAAKINIFGKDTRSNLSFYLKTLKKMSTAIMKEPADLKGCNNQASTARDTMTKLNDHIQAEGTLKALEAVVAELKEEEQSKNKSESDDDFTIIENALKGASRIVQEITRGLLRYIKEELRKALEDGELFINADALDEEVEKVKETITQVKNACRENILALGNVMEQLCKDGKGDEAFLKSLKSNAEALSKSCDEKLPSVSPDSTPE